MTAFRAPFAALQEDCAAILATEGITTPHYRGEKHRSAHGEPPRYVWVATRSRDRNETPPRNESDDIRPLLASQEHIEIDCWGASEDQAWALRQNLIFALHHSAQASITFEGGEWLGQGKAWNQCGEVYRLEVSMNVPAIDAVVDPTALIEPEPDTFTVETVEAGLYLSPDPESDDDSEDELGPTVTITDE